jgi:hypothetical protein
MFKIKAKVDIGKVFIDEKTLNESIVKTLDKLGNDMIGDYNKTTETWKVRPKFFKETEKAKEVWMLHVYYTNQIYAHVDLGTGQAAGNRGDWYPIVAVNADALRYQINFTPRTTPKKLGSRTGGKFGPWRIVKSVEHPGITPREFTQTIADKYIPQVRERILEGLNVDTSKSSK